LVIHNRHFVCCRFQRRRDGRVAEGGGLLNLSPLLTRLFFNSFARVSRGLRDAVRADSGPIHKANTQSMGTQNARVLAGNGTPRSMAPVRSSSTAAEKGNDQLPKRRRSAFRAPRRRKFPATRSIWQSLTRLRLAKPNDPSILTKEYGRVDEESLPTCMSPYVRARHLFHKAQTKRMESIR
jgi:hypothetical protein